MWLRQSTISVINFGPVLDFADGVTLETAAGIITSLDHATTGIMLSKNGGTLAVREQGANFVATTYDAHGCYKVSLSAIDTGTLGRLRVIHTEPVTYLAIWQDFMVVPADLWDSIMVAQPAAAIKKLFDVVTPVLTCESVNQVQDNATTGEIKTAIEAAGSSIAAILEDTGTTLDGIVDAIKVKTDTLGGAGAITWTYTLTDADTGGPIDGAEVWISTDSGGANIIASGITNSIGVIIFTLDAATLYFWRKKAGYNFTNPVETVVA